MLSIDLHSNKLSLRGFSEFIHYVAMVCKQRFCLLRSFISSHNHCLYNRLESANKRLEDELSQVSLQKEEEMQTCKRSLLDEQSQNQAVSIIGSLVYGQCLTNEHLMISHSFHVFDKVWVICMEVKHLSSFSDVYMCLTRR